MDVQRFLPQFCQEFLCLPWLAPQGTGSVTVGSPSGVNFVLLGCHLIVIAHFSD
jgi:hypothetical protein